MALAFLTGALAAGLGTSALTALVVWVVTVISGSPDLWVIGGWVIAGLGLLVAGLTYVAERFAREQTYARQRASGEPWAYRR
jgi:cell division protein FtsW (lipid II flippase)